MGTHLSSNSRASLRKAFLHFLQMKTISKLWSSGWSAVSWWHSAQSNHFLPVCYEHRMRGPAAGHLQQGERMATWAFKTCLLNGALAAATATTTTARMVRACFLPHGGGRGGLWGRGSRKVCGRECCPGQEG